MYKSLSTQAFRFNFDHGNVSTSPDGTEPVSRFGFDQSNPKQGTNSLTHVTISTGHSNVSMRHEVTDDVINTLVCWIKRAMFDLKTGIKKVHFAAPVPTEKDYLATFTHDQGCLLVTLIHQQFGPFLTFGVSQSDAEGAHLWALLGSKMPQPTGAWCGARFEAGIFLAGTAAMKDLMWIGDFERCVAWAWFSLLESENEAESQSVQEEVMERTPIKEGAFFDYDELGPVLRIFLDDPTQTEIQSVLRGKCQFKLVICDQVIFLMAKFADMYWLDAPYSIRLLPADQRKLCSEYVEGKRYGLMVTLYDTHTNDQCGTRLVTWNPHFSAMFHSSVKSQLAGDFSRQKYEETIRNTYSSLTSSQLCSMARAHTKGGD
jgi:hypothetical protein